MHRHARTQKRNKYTQPYLNAGEMSSPQGGARLGRLKRPSRSTRGELPKGVGKEGRQNPGSRVERAAHELTSNAAIGIERVP